MTDRDYMAMAIEEAKKGMGWVNPNPMVGAIVVKDGRVVSTGYHASYGGDHAERMALKDCGEEVRGATLYVTLEPCCHTGKTPPCTQIILEKGIARVVVGSLDPNPKVAGGGIAVLREAGIAVETGVLGERCDAFYRPFFHYITTKQPYVLMKYAMTADGKIATESGASRWVSGEASREQTQALRCELAGIMVGIGTVLADDPALTCRQPGGRNPLRIICDSRLRIPMDSQIVTTAASVPTIIAMVEGSAEKVKALEGAGCEVLSVEKDDAGEVSLKALMAILGDRGVDSILLEGGATLNASALGAGIVSIIRCYLAPKIFGGKKAPGPVGGLGVAVPDLAVPLELMDVHRIGGDLVIDWRMTCSQVL